MLFLSLLYHILWDFASRLRKFCQCWERIPMGNFKFRFSGLTEKSASLLVMTPPPASREPPRRGSLLPRPAETLYPTSDSYPRPKAPSSRGLRPQAVGEFTVMGIFTLSNSSTNPNLPTHNNPLTPQTRAWTNTDPPYQGAAPPRSSPHSRGAPPPQWPRATPHPRKYPPEYPRGEPTTAPRHRPPPR